MNAALLWGWYPRLYPWLRLQWKLLLFFEGDIPDYKGSHFFLQRKRSLKVLVWIRIPGSGTDWKKFQQTENIILYARVCYVVREGKDNDDHHTVCVVCVVLWEGLGQWWSSHCCSHESHGVHNELWWCWPVPPQKRKYRIRWKYPQFLQRPAKTTQEYSLWWKCSSW